MSDISNLFKIQFKIWSAFLGLGMVPNFVFTQNNPAEFGKELFFFASHCFVICMVCLSALCCWHVFPKSCIEGSMVLETCKNLGRLCYSLEKMSRGGKWF